MCISQNPKLIFCLDPNWNLKISFLQKVTPKLLFLENNLHRPSQYHAGHSLSLYVIKVNDKYYK